MLLKLARSFHAQYEIIEHDAVNGEIDEHRKISQINHTAQHHCGIERKEDEKHDHRPAALFGKQPHHEKYRQNSQPERDSYPQIEVGGSRAGLNRRLL